MDLKARFTLYFSLLFATLLAFFTIHVYFQVKQNVLDTTERALLSHLDHDAQHIGHSHEMLHARPSTAHGDNVYLRLKKDGRLIEDSYPKRVESADSPERLVRRVNITRGSHQYELEGFIDLTSAQAYLAALRRALLLGCALAMLIVVPFGFFSTRLLLAPFRELAEKTSQLDVKNLSFRFQEPARKDEYGILVRNFNQLLTRLDASFSQMRRFATNASHELRTPLSVVIGQAEMALRRPRTVEEHREVTEKILSRAKHLRELINRLLTLADLERAGAESAGEEISVDKTLQEVLETIRLAYRASEKKIVVRQEDTGVPFRGNEEIVRTIVSNLVENAFKYSRSAVAVEVSRTGPSLRFRVEDDGPGIPAGARAQVFEPFSRKTMPDGSPAAGHGFGLAIVDACVRAHDGSIRLGQSDLGGLSVDVLLSESV